MMYEPHSIVRQRPVATMHQPQLCDV